MRIAVVIPALDEATRLESAVPQLGPSAEIIVVADGGSHDDTVRVARRLGAEVVHSRTGRGEQLNAGAARAIELGAQVLVFLHADSTLPANGIERIAEAMAAGACGGGFGVRFDDPRRRFRLGSRLVDLRTHLLRAPLGDQAQFVSREAFRTLGGFRQWPILEDLDFIYRLRSVGRVVVLPGAVTTSARRFVEHGITRTIVRNWSIWLLFALGVSPRRLAAIYPPPASRAPEPAPCRRQT